MSIEMRLDISRCIGCRACEVACVTANGLPPAHSRNWVPHVEASASARALAVFTPYLCAHCSDPPCVPACPTGASYQAEDGRVLVDRDRCIGCGLCVPACPYEARHVEPESNKLEKCTLCEGRVAAGRAPACFEVCPAGARHVIDDTGARPVQVGEPDQLDPGTEELRLTTAAIDPRPRLRFSGRPADLALLRRAREPRSQPALPSTLWQNGVGLAVQTAGLAAIAAMAGMVGLRWLRSRRGQPSQQEQELRESPATAAGKDEG